MCDCRVCTMHRRLYAAIDPKTELAKAALEELFEVLAHAETDATYYRLKFEGKWPSDQPTGDQNA